MSGSHPTAKSASPVRCVCIRCGRIRIGLRTLCPACGGGVDEDSLEFAWLLSSHHLSEDDLSAASARIQSGDAIRPSPEMRLKARRAMRRTFQDDQGFAAKELALLCVVGLVATPLPGWLLGYWWRQSRPRAAVQALFISASCTLLYAGTVVWVLFG